MCPPKNPDRFTSFIIDRVSRQNIVRALDEVLHPSGYVRRNATWNRRHEQRIDVIDLQRSRVTDTVTLNIGVLDVEVHRAVWQTELGNVVDEPHCAVRVRVGFLIGQTDRWWRVADAHTPTALATIVTDTVLPFLSRMSSRTEMIRFLEEPMALNRLPAALISRAVLLGLCGQPDAACEVLKRVRVGGWSERAREIGERLKCH